MPMPKEAAASRTDMKSTPKKPDMVLNGRDEVGRLGRASECKLAPGGAAGRCQWWWWSRGETRWTAWTLGDALRSDEVTVSARVPSDAPSITCLCCRKPYMGGPESQRA